MTDVLVYLSLSLVVASVVQLKGMWKSLIVVPCALAITLMCELLASGTIWDYQLPIVSLVCLNLIAYTIIRKLFMK